MHGSVTVFGEVLGFDVSAVWASAGKVLRVRPSKWWLTQKASTNRYPRTCCKVKAPGNSNGFIGQGGDVSGTASSGKPHNGLGLNTALLVAQNSWCAIGWRLRSSPPASPPWLNYACPSHLISPVLILNQGLLWYTPNERTKHIFFHVSWSLILILKHSDASPVDSLQRYHHTSLRM